MPRTPPGLPDARALAAGLEAVLQGADAPTGRVAFLRREPNVYGSTFPTEIVTCRVADGGVRRFFCKYATAESNTDFGHRGGIALEADVYHRVLQPLGVSVPRFFGTASDPATGRDWIVLEYLEDNAPLAEAPDPGPELPAARWIGRFHAANEARLGGEPMPFLTRYDAAYYLGWAQRTAAAVGGRHHRRYPWVGGLCERFNEVLAPLLASGATVIHGEFYPPNILVQGGVIYPVDWESAAVGAGEIDLASLTEDWPAAAARECEREYRQARWPEGAPADFEQRLTAARMYLTFRWLADDPNATARRPNPWYLKQLRSAGRRLGMLQP